jgi:hypothetical protein
MKLLKRRKTKKRRGLLLKSHERNMKRSQKKEQGEYSW